MVQLNPIIILKIIFIECHHFGRKLILHSFLVMRTFKVHSLSNFEISNRVLLTRVTVLCICTLHVAPLPSPYLWGPPVCYCLFFFFLFCIYEYVALSFFLVTHILWYFCQSHFTVYDALKVHPCSYKCQDCILLVWLNNTLYTYDISIPQSLYLLVCWWTRRVFAYSHVLAVVHAHSGAGVSSSQCFLLLRGG